MLHITNKICLCFFCYLSKIFYRHSPGISELPGELKCSGNTITCAQLDNESWTILKIDSFIRST